MPYMKKHFTRIKTLIYHQIYTKFLKWKHVRFGNNRTPKQATSYKLMGRKSLGENGMEPQHVVVMYIQRHSVMRSYCPIIICILFLMFLQLCLNKKTSNFFCKGTATETINLLHELEGKRWREHDFSA
jgi:hypothetical protein